VPPGGQVTHDVARHVRRLAPADLRALRNATIEEAARHIANGADRLQITRLVELLDRLDRRLAAVDDAVMADAAAGVARRQRVAAERRPLHTAGG
jgi:hypothetical protein